MAKNNTNETFNFEIIETLAVLRTSPAGWTREFNIVSWNEGEPCYDIRDWSPDHTKLTKGVSFKRDEAKEIFDALMNDLINGNSIVDTDYTPASNAAK